MSYSRILAHYPAVVIAAICVLSIACLVVILTAGEMPKFQDPKAGFEPRGTEIGRRIKSWNNLLDSTVTVDTLPSYPYLYQGSKQMNQEEFRQPLATKHHININRHQENRTGKMNWNARKRYFCDEPRKEYARIVYQAIDGGNLFTYENIKTMCAIEKDEILGRREFTNICTRGLKAKCCASWSLGNYVAMLSNKSTCDDITALDVGHTLQRVQKCSAFYFNFTLESDCWSWEDSYLQNILRSKQQRRKKCQKIPLECWQYNAVYEILHYLTDVDFMQKGTESFFPHLSYAITFLPIAVGTATIPLYKEISNSDLQNGNIKVIAIQFDIKYALFDDFLKDDTLWIGVALTIILICIWLYTTSLFITIMTVSVVVLSLKIAYFLYTMVFEIKFFPFMNLLTIVIAIGIGADDVFIYCKIWCLAKSEKNNGTLDKIISDTLKHATLSMFVTTFTTAAAFYVNYISNITAIRCFAIYAGTTVLANFLLMVTWIPASIVIQEKWCSCCYSPNRQNHSCWYTVCHWPYELYDRVADWSRIFFEKLLPCIVIKARYLWLALFGCMGICGIVFILRYPGMKLPTSREFQVFSRDHPFEVYDYDIRDKFWFEKAAGTNVPMMPLTAIWGVKAIDNGNMLDPTSSGTLVLDNTFDISAKESQIWLLKFCRKLRRHKYYKNSPGLELTNCFIEQFKQMFMERPCKDSNGHVYEPCCDKYKFPYPEEVFRECVRQYTPEVSRLPFVYNKMAGPRYSKDSGKIVALIVEFNSQIPFTNSYLTMEEFYQTMNSWTEKEMLSAPPEFKNGWFISELKFYDLQNTIASGTPVAIGVAITVSLVMIFFTTLNLLISLYALLTIVVTISITVGSLVLLGWQLGVLESTTISIAVGLSIDFTLHYGVAYRLSPDLDRETRVVCSIERMGSAIAMAAVTTFLAGALMMPSTILAYRHIGTFIMIVMTSSWFCSTFFFQSLLRVIGPQGSFGQFHWPSSDCCSSNREHVDKTVYALSESTMSTSSTNHATNSSETHELEPLTNIKGSRLDQKNKFPRRFSRELQRRLSSASLGSNRRDSNIQEPPKMTRPIQYVSYNPPVDNPVKEEIPSTSVKPQNDNNDNSDEIWVRRTDIPVNVDVII
ncbi:protein dispatched homolog 1-like isoform X2 [Tubulanus polymorphus]|uniref:protein dispatched homolog 1-like isoform X2 n=1 Tax=Tubulanus polymorphus TaxID=672921 RepID=UPI003DA3F8E8